ncbi:spore coat protein GerQ [Evansella cellulosilytica]|uniref:Spore coat protein GerQ n=1 Tax=Evansella cellulosilytica (strain ATCC 21833 / DSM 2522 / FERM P-1141 / JCM 9156 / N-4) TaxID=649639 RepID=E6TY45_EVAC2|nr:spore coat protein GerQ [Evansella cellulosilytica]ADU32364.1 spore coat protein GerQ [Evansella cellulosilytica DSM 2522]
MYPQQGFPFPQYGGGFPQGAPGAVPGTPQPGFAQQQQFADPFAQGQLPLEQSFIENILRLNRGKVGTFYMTFENNERWNAKVFKGVVEAAGRDHIILSDPQTGKRYLLLMINLDYVTFDEELEYDYPYANGVASAPAPAPAQQDLSTYSPRD